MSSHPLNLALRFVLELAALAAVGVWGWQRGDGVLRFILALGLPSIVAVLWATFRVPNDPGPAPVAVPGIVRLAFELLLFSCATWALYDVHAPLPAAVVGIAVLLHYVTSFDRILWMLKQ
jgi:hypothetical protein